LVVLKDEILMGNAEPVADSTLQAFLSSGLVACIVSTNSYLQPAGVEVITNVHKELAVALRADLSHQFRGLFLALLSNRKVLAVAFSAISNGFGALNS
jgi:hypothetical protein